MLAAASAPGAALALLADGRPVVLAAIGRRSPDQPAAPDPADRFLIYSLTKPLIAAVVLRLAEQERVALDAPVQAYLPRLPLQTPVTLRQLLSHTGGLPDYGGLPAYTQALRADPTHPWSESVFLAETMRQGLLFSPGHGWAYSNIGFMLLRQTLEAVLGAPLRAVLEEHLIAPLKLTRTRVVETLDDAGLLSPGYSDFFSADGAPRDIRSLYHPGWVSHGVVGAPAGDVARLLDALFAGPLLGEASRAALADGVDVPGTHPLFGRPGYGLGVMIDRASPYGVLIGHGGGGPGYSAGGLHLPDVGGHRITSVALVNSDRGDAGLPLAHRMLMLAAESLAGV